MVEFIINDLLDITEDHRDEIESIIRLEFQVVLFHIVDGQALLVGDLLRIPNRPLGKIDPGDLCSVFGKGSGVQSRPTAEICNTGGVVDAEP